MFAKMFDVIVFNSNAYKDLTNRHSTIMRQMEDMKSSWHRHKANTDSMAGYVEDLLEEKRNRDSVLSGLKVPDDSRF